MQIAEYKNIHETSLRDIDKKVNYYISEGWQPLNGVTCIKIGNGNRYVQTLVKYENPVDIKQRKTI